MRQKSNGKFILKTLASPLSLLILGAITVWLGTAVLKEAHRKQEVTKEVKDFQLEIEELEQKNKNFTALISSLKDSRTRELEAKRRLNLKKTGEEVAVILRDKNEEPQNIVEQNSSPLVSVRETPREEINPIKWWRYIISSRD